MYITKICRIENVQTIVILCMQPIFDLGKNKFSTLFLREIHASEFAEFWSLHFILIHFSLEIYPTYAACSPNIFQIPKLMFLYSF